MNAATQSRQESIESVAVFVHHLQTLTGEIEGAMDAIEANDLARLTDSVGRQQTLAATLPALAKTFDPRSSLSSSGSQLGLAAGALQTANLKYAALLKHSGRTIAVLASLCNSHAGEMKEVRGTRPKRQTWSCEM